LAGLLVLVNVPKHRKNNIAQTPISAAAPCQAGILSMTGTSSFLGASLTAESGSDSFHESVLVGEGKEFFILNTTEDAPVAISGHAKRLGD
jgi:hypothetical protein